MHIILYQLKINQIKYYNIYVFYYYLEIMGLFVEFLKYQSYRPNIITLMFTLKWMTGMIIVMKR